MCVSVCPAGDSGPVPGSEERCGGSCRSRVRTDQTRSDQIDPDQTIARTRETISASVSLCLLSSRVQMDQDLQNQKKDQQDQKLKGQNIEYQQNQELQAIRAELMELRTLVQQLVQNRTDSN